MNPQQQAIYNSRIEKMKKDGFFLPSIRPMSGDTRYLIVSYGGTGAAGLFGVKKAFEAQLDADELKQRVRFLAIDTDSATQKETDEEILPDGTKRIVETDALTNEQFFQLSGAEARFVYGKDANIKTWLNPKVKAKIDTQSELLNGTGASGTRQIGRLTLYPANTVKAIRTRISSLVGALTNGNAAKLKVFIITGIAGGTGSGTVVDMTYLMRDVIKNMPGGVNSRTSYAGFVMLPPTGASKDPVEVKRGNRNGYAAMKEINHFMTLKQKGEIYSMQYGDGSVVQSDEQIFDICYLMDGVQAGVAFANPRMKVVRVLAECLLDMVSSTQLDDKGENVQTVDSFMNDQRTYTTGMIAGKSITHAMRDADYVYCALGHSEFKMPKNEIKAYVAKQLFDRIYGLFQNCSNVTPEDAEKFVERVLNHNPKGANAVMRAVLTETDIVFQNYRGSKGGPYFAVNLLKEAINAVNSQRGKIKMFRYKMASDETLNQMEAAFLQVNNDVFSVYTMALNSVAELMSDQFKSVVVIEADSTTYSFMPDRWGKMAGAEYIVSYLNGLINPNTLNIMTNNLLQEMVQKRSEWTGMMSTDPSCNDKMSTVLRKFWNDHLDKLVSNTLEDFLIKFYSGNPAAYYDVQNHEATAPYLNEAAAAIFNQMLDPNAGAANPMVEFIPSGLTLNDFNGHTYLLVPKSAPHLKLAIENYAKGVNVVGNAVKVCSSEGDESISCYVQYTSIPAFKLRWVSNAEPIYEEDLKTPAGEGMHMSETALGNVWKNFSNLLPESTWPTIPGAVSYFDSREKKLADTAQQLFRDARKMGLTTAYHIAGGAQGVNYDVKILPAAFRPNAELYNDIELCPPDSEVWKNKQANIDAAAEACAQALFAKVSGWESDAHVPADLAQNGVAFEERKLHFPGTVMTVGSGDAKRPDWDEYMAGCMLRKLPQTMNDLEGTLLVMGKLVKRVKEYLDNKKLLQLFARYITVDLFTFDETLQQWQFEDANGFAHSLAYLDSQIEEICQLYFMYNGMKENKDAVVKALDARLAAFVPDPKDPTTRVARQKAFRENAKAKADGLKAWMNPSSTPIHPVAKIVIAKGYDGRAIISFHRALYEELMMIYQMGYTPVVLQEEPAPDPFKEDSNFGGNAAPADDPFGSADPFGF